MVILKCLSNIVYWPTRTTSIIGKLHQLSRRHAGRDLVDQLPQFMAILNPSPGVPELFILGESRLSYSRCKRSKHLVGARRQIDHAI